MGNSDAEKTEFWLRGPLPDIPPLLQPAAHALLQVSKELNEHTLDFPNALLWKKPYGRASVGFHMLHVTGVLDRMMSYSKSEMLTEDQFTFLKDEGMADSKKTVTELVRNFDDKVEEALAYFKTIPDDRLTEVRTVGRKKLPSTLIGLLFHAAEHGQRHLGQLLVTVSILKGQGTELSN